MITPYQPTRARKRLPCGCWIAIAFVCFYGYMIVEWVHYAPSIHLFDLDRGSATASIVWPYGELHQLILGIPGNESQQPPEFKGTVSFFDGDRLVKKQEVSSSNADSCNWLERYNCPWAFILTWPNGNSWDATLKPGTHLRIVANIKGDLPKGSSLWLSLVQNKRAMWKTARVR